MSNVKNIDSQAIVTIMQQRFPMQYEICLQAAYITNLENALEEGENEDGDELSE